MTKLSDLQLILLTNASQRPDRSILPPPENLADQLKRLRPAIGGLLKRGLIAEVEQVPDAQSWRIDGDQHVGLAITEHGFHAIGVEMITTEPATDDQPGVDPINSVGAKPGTKQASVMALLRREQGATLAELVEVTGWLPHTTRAALTGLRKKGHVLAKFKRGEVTCYRAEAA